jgi:hypothetical protein
MAGRFGALRPVPEAKDNETISSEDDHSELA